MPRGPGTRLLRVALRPLVSRLDRRWAGPVDPLRESVRRLEHRADALERSTTALFDHARRADEGAGADAAPLLLDAVATQHAALRVAARRDNDVWEAIRRSEHHLAEVQQRIEVVRREVLFELMYGRKGPTERGAPAEAGAVTIESKVLDEAKVESMRNALRLNVGSGSLAVDGYVNVDVRAIEGVDVVADVGDIPFDDGSVEEVRSAHVLEHFPEEELRRRVLPHWVAKLRPGGTLRAIVPDAVSMMQAWAEKELTFEDLREVTFGAQDYEGNFHFTMFSVDSLTGLLEEAGLAEVEVVRAGARNGMCLEMELVARRPEGRPAQQ